MRLERKYLGLVSNPEILIKKISFSSLTLRYWEKNLVLVSNPEILRKKSRSRLEPWDIDKKISFSSRNSRFREQNSRSRLEPWDWERQNLEKWKDSISFVGVVCKALIDPVSQISSSFFPFRMQMIRNRFKFWLSGGCVKALICLYIQA